MRLPADVQGWLEANMRGRAVSVTSEAPILLHSPTRERSGVIYDRTSVARFDFVPPRDGCVRIVSSLGLSLSSWGGWGSSLDAVQAPPAVAVDLVIGDAALSVGSSDFWERFPVGNPNVMLHELDIPVVLKALEGFAVELRNMGAEPVRCVVQASIWRVQVHP